jgi:hypothetical protein
MKKLIIEQLRKLITEEIDRGKIRIKKQSINGLLIFSPYYEDEKMGGFRTKPFEDGYMIDSTILYDRFRGFGIGKDIYLYIIKTLAKENKPLYSDLHQTPEAKDVWEKLVAKGYADRTENGYKSKN